MYNFLGKIAQNPWGTVNPPPGVASYPNGPAGLSTLLNIILKTLIVGAGIFATINLLLAGYTFMSAGGDPKKIEEAWAKIWQTLLGLTVAAGAFVLAAIFGKLIFGDYNALLQLKIFTPK